MPPRAGAAFAGGVKYASPQAAFEQGLGAYKSGYYEIAIPALEEAAAKGAELNKFFAEFYLARIYSDNASAVTDHAKAYLLFQKLADDNADADPDDGQRAPFVAKALTALAGYLRRGVKEIGVAPDPERAVDYLHHAATFFGDKDAQFELAKVYLGGVGTPEDVKRGMHYLSVLTEEGYPGAQAFLADLLWRGRYVKKDERRALALITDGGRERARARAHLDRGHLPEHLLRHLAGHAQAGRRHRCRVAQDVLPVPPRPATAWGSAPGCSRSAPAATASWSISTATARTPAKERRRQWRCRRRRGPERCRAAPPALASATPAR